MGQGGSKDNRSGSTGHHEPAIPVTHTSGAPSSADGSGAAAVPVPFFWKDEGHTVYLVGSFSNWNNKLPMVRGADGFSTTVLLAPGISYEYKFIVDGQWKCAQQQPTAKDRVGNENNWIHVENSSAAGASAAAAAATAADGGLAPLLPSDPLTAMNLLETPDSPRDSYTSEQPKQDLFVKEPPLMPPHLTQCVLTQAASFNDILLTAPPSHVVLNHLYHSELPQHELQSFAVTRRLGAKFVTSVMYLPFPSASGTVSPS